jgi:PPOX class probable F420-dependent enzyme
MSLRLSPDEAWNFVDRAHTGILTTLRSDGSPVALPVWFMTLERTVCIGAPAGTKKITRVRRDPRASFLVEQGERWAELQAVHLSGRVEIVADENVASQVAQALDDKYREFRTPAAAMPEDAQKHYARRTILRLHPEGRILSWDNRRIGNTPSTLPGGDA